MNGSVKVKTRSSRDMDSSARNAPLTPKVPRRSSTNDHLNRFGSRRSRKRAGLAGEIVRRGWKIQHRALRENLGGGFGRERNRGHQNLGVNLLCHRCVGNCFLQTCRVTKGRQRATAFKFCSCISVGWGFCGTRGVLRFVQRFSASHIRFEAQLSQRNWLPD